jgi:hypothetical protein
VRDNQGPACGAFQAIGNEVTLIDRKTGQPVRGNQGRLYTKQPHRGNEDAQRIAKRLLKEYDAATSRKFGRSSPLSAISIPLNGTAIIPS